MHPDVVQALVTVAFGALAGGLTNTIAIWMLFHPYEPPTLGGRPVGWLQGAVPKNQERLASAIGRTVGTKLLTAEDLARIFRQPEFRDAFDDRLAAFLDEVLHRERGPLRDLLPPGLAPEIDRILDDLVDRGMDSLDGWLDGPGFEEAVLERSDELVEAVADAPIAGILTPAREAALTEAVDQWLLSAVESDDFRRALDDYLERSAHRLLKPERTFEEVLPLGLVSSLERAIAGYLPLAIERLGGLLEDPDARAKFEGTLRNLFQHLLRDLRFHQRVVARLVVTDETLDRVLDTIQEEGAERLSEMLRDPTVQEAMAKGVNEAIVDFLRRPVRSVLGEPDSASVADARETLAGWVVRMASDPQTRAFLVDKLQQGMERAGARTWGEVLERVPREQVVGWVVQAARSRGARTLYRRAAHGAADALMARPVGTPARWLPDDGPERLEAGVGPVLWEWLQTQIPTVVERMDVGRRVEEKVLDFPVPKLEALVRRVTDRELRLIVRLGYLLGAVIGVILVVVDRVIG
jgi:uncharacterized membrane protein YheB (UPF0754 family)